MSALKKMEHTLHVLKYNCLLFYLCWVDSLCWCHTGGIWYLHVCFLFHPYRVEDLLDLEKLRDIGWMDMWKKIAEEELQTMLYTSLADQVSYHLPYMLCAQCFHIKDKDGLKIDMFLQDLGFLTQFLRNSIFCMIELTYS